MIYGVLIFVCVCVCVCFFSRHFGGCTYPWSYLGIVFCTRILGGLEGFEVTLDRMGGYTIPGG